MTPYIVPLSFVLLNLEIVEREKKLKKFEYIKNEKRSLDEMKNIFNRFLRAIMW